MKLGIRQKHILLFIRNYQPVSISKISNYLKIPKSIVATIIISLYDKKCIESVGFHSWKVSNKN